MKVKSLQIDKFRNLSDINYTPADDINVIYGNNAQGKTNLLEAIWLFSGMKSFRGSKDVEFIPQSSEFAKLSLGFFSSGRDYNANMLFAKEKKEFLVNEVVLRTHSELSRYFCCVSFAPEHNMIIKGAPSYRRGFLDGAISQLFPKYTAVLSDYKKAVGQRNVIIKDISLNADLLDTLFVYDSMLAKLGTIITKYRIEYINKLLPELKEIYSSMTSGNENIELCYESTIYTDDFLRENITNMNALYEKYLEALTKNRQQDIAGRATTCGIHRDDFVVLINDSDSRIFGSQGQQRSCVLALKLAQTRIITTQIGETPIILLDDVMSELDSNRKSYLLNKIDGYQVFITCCDKDSVEMLKVGKAVEIKSGKLI